MAHFHKLSNGKETGVDIPDSENSELHWHQVNGVETSTDAYGPGHTHSIDGAATGGPIEQLSRGEIKEIENHLDRVVAEIKGL